VGTLVSGTVYYFTRQLEYTLWISTGFSIMAAIISRYLGDVPLEEVAKQASSGGHD
jgi:hypothetical protein